MWTMDEYTAAHAGATAAARAGKQVYLALDDNNRHPIAVVPLAKFIMTARHTMAAPPHTVLRSGIISHVSIRDADNIWLSGPAGPETFQFKDFAFDAGEKIALEITDTWATGDSFLRLVADVAMIYLSA